MGLGLGGAYLGGDYANLLLGANFLFLDGHGEVLGGVDAEAVDPEVCGGCGCDGFFVGCFGAVDVGDFEFDGDEFVVWEDLAAVFPGDLLAEGDGLECGVF